MSSVRSNFAANLAGQAWVTLTQLLVVPLYIKLLGIEAYGLMGFFFALQATVQILDLGLGAALAREIARRRAVEGGLADARSLVMTVSLVYLGLSVLIGLAIILAAPLFATHVIHAQKLDRHTVEHAVVLMGLIFPVMWGTSLFNATLMGMERQVLVNLLRIVAVTASSLGAVAVLWLVSADITTFFLWHLFTGALSWLAAGWIAHRVLPAAPSHVRVAMLRDLWRFAAGMSGISAGGIVLTQIDKWLLINLLPLESYGHYILAAALANALSYMVAALFNSILPRMTLLHARHDESGLSRLYHSSAQYIAAFVLPLAAIIGLFSEQVLRLWTQDAEIARNAAPIASILVCGTALNGLMIVPYALQIATGNTWLALRLVMLILALFVPAIVLLTLQFGATGAAAAWLLLNAVYLVAGITLTHSYLLKGHAGAWITKDVLPAAAAALAAGAIAFALRPVSDGAFANLGFLAAATMAALLAAGLAGNEPRAWITLQARKIGSLRSGS